LNAGKSYVEFDVSSSILVVSSRSWVWKSYVDILTGTAQARNVVYVP